MKVTPESSNQLFELLSHHRRRYALRCLRDEPDGIPLRELSNRLSQWESVVGETSTPVDPDEVHSSLDDSHIPELEAHDAVVFDRESRVVTYALTGPERGLVEALLDQVEQF